MSAVLLPQLSDPETGDPYMNKEQGSWFGMFRKSSLNQKLHFDYDISTIKFNKNTDLSKKSMLFLF